MGSCLSKKSDVNRTDVVALKSKSVDETPGKITRVVKTEDVKKEICVTKHRKSHEKKIQPEQKQKIQMQSRVDNIAIGTPVRTSSCTREEVDAILIQCGRLSRSSSANTPSGKKYSGSKRSYDFDAEVIVGNAEEVELEKQRKSRSRSSPSKPGRRRTTPSRERDSNQQRSGSRERSVAGSGRRVSRSPGRRSDTPVGFGNDVTNGVAMPVKLVSVPASLTSSIVVKRDVRSPRSQSPSQLRQQPPQQPLTLSRSSSKKTDQSPYRRNPLTEIDNNQNHQGADEGSNRNLSNKKAAAGGVAKMETKVVQQPKVNQPKQTRTKSLSRSRDFEELSRGLNPILNTNASSYASILLEDIQTFHQKSSNNNVAPQNVTNAFSIMHAVADLNSTTNSSAVSKDEKKRMERMMYEARDSFVETELSVCDDLMEPSLHKYVTMRRRGDMGDEESSGSNSVAGGSQQLLGSPLESNSVESSVCLTSKASKRRPFEPYKIQIRS